MRILTDFADQAVLLPLILAVGTILLALGWGRAARAWAFAVPGTLVAMLVLKIIFLACAPLWPDLPLRSPSGHVAAAAAVYGSIAWLLGLRPSWLMAAAAAAVIGASRLALGVHNPAEVALGAVVGGLLAVVVPGPAATLTALLPDTVHRFRLRDTSAQVPVVTHVRLDIHPDGGVNRLRLLGEAAPSA